MAGQVRHKQIFSAIRPDWRLAKLLLSLRVRSTDVLLGAVAKVLSDEGIELISSTAYLEPMLARAGVLTSRSPTERERADIDYGLTVARGIAAFDLGQTVVIAGGACVAVEAMEGTDATIARAGALMGSLEGDASALGRSLTVVKVAKPKQDLRFDVPVVGVPTVQAMRAAGATCLAIEAGHTPAVRRTGHVARSRRRRHRDSWGGAPWLICAVTHKPMNPGRMWARQLSHPAVVSHTRDRKLFSKEF